MFEIHASSIKFIDNDDPWYSYEILAKDLIAANFTSPWAESNRILIKLAGKKYYIDLEPRALKERVIAEICKMLGSQ